MTRGINDLAPSIEVPFGPAGGDAAAPHRTGGMAVHHGLGDVTIRRVGRGVTVSHLPPVQRARAVHVIRNRKGQSSFCNALVAAAVTVGVIGLGLLVNAARGYFI